MQSYTVISTDLLCKTYGSLFAKVHFLEYYSVVTYEDSIMPDKPTFAQRYDDYMRMLDWNVIIEQLDLAYTQTLNENVYSVLRILRTMQQDIRNNEILLTEADVQF